MAVFLPTSIECPPATEVHAFPYPLGHAKADQRDVLTLGTLAIIIAGESRHIETGNAPLSGITITAQTAWYDEVLVGAFRFEEPAEEA